MRQFKLSRFCLFSKNYKKSFETNEISYRDFFPEINYVNFFRQKRKIILVSWILHVCEIN